ncbi:hypothetical protein TrVE_jg5194 [Triparma verrucosa]|uniref:Uncharacterized protein n=1 Tax=Triparma verrucosa TaxID=1606542 RepID=A0A9W7B855_9STRA|nr:hypothetical protein TrVE_jg5194 [Triparma verrucosa]
MSQFSGGAKPSRHEGDLARWPAPKWKGPLPETSENGQPFNPHIDTYPHHMLVPLPSLPLMPVHLSWVLSKTVEWGFSDPSETLRHLIFVTISEPSNNKKLIFRIKRCLHCHVGARERDHGKVEVEGGVQLYRFQVEWLENVKETCSIKSVSKCVRIICDYYMSRIKAASIEASKSTASVEAKTGDEVESEIFTMKREHDSRVKVARLKMEGVSSEDDQVVQILSDEIQSLPTSCTPEETLAAIKKCQVGRAAATFAEANLESPEETSRRREEEEKVENTQEMKQMREVIRKTLGSVMG